MVGEESQRIRETAGENEYFSRGEYFTKIIT